jgi:hypothetical protein
VNDLPSSRREAEHQAEMLTIQEHDAWFEYLDSCVKARDRRSGPQYEDIEPWAWSRLQQRLKDVKKRRKNAA